MTMNESIETKVARLDERVKTIFNATKYTKSRLKSLESTCNDIKTDLNTTGIHLVTISKQLDTLNKNHKTSRAQRTAIVVSLIAGISGWVPEILRLLSQ